MTEQQRCVHCGKLIHPPQGNMPLWTTGTRFMGVSCSRSPTNVHEPAAPEPRSEPHQHQSSPEHYFCIKCGAWLDDSSAPYIRTQPATSLEPCSEPPDVWTDIGEGKEICLHGDVRRKQPAAPPETPQIPDGDEWRSTLLEPLKDASPAVLRAIIKFHAKRAQLAESALAAERARSESRLKKWSDTQDKLVAMMEKLDVERARRERLETALREIEEGDCECQCDDHTSEDCCAKVIGRDPGFFCAHCYAGAALVQTAQQSAATDTEGRG